MQKTEYTAPKKIPHDELPGKSHTRPYVIFQEVHRGEFFFGAVYSVFCGDHFGKNRFPIRRLYRMLWLARVSCFDRRYQITGTDLGCAIAIFGISALKIVGLDTFPTKKNFLSKNFFFQLNKNLTIFGGR